MMKYCDMYPSPLGRLLIVADEKGLTDVMFEHEYWADSVTLTPNKEILRRTREWFDIYFTGKDPGFTPPLHSIGSKFCVKVWKILLGIPFGQTTTYGSIAETIAGKRSKPMSARAVGGAVGRNRIPIIIPCHRVVGIQGRLTGYSGGMDKKIALLSLEGWKFNKDKPERIGRDFDET